MNRDWDEEDDLESEAKPGTLFVVATPIGNLNDLSSRAIEVLRSVDLIACEDTRQTSKLLSRFSISVRLTSLHEHNEAQKAPRLVDLLLKGDNLALVSDAGTPLVSDPGYRLVRSCRELAIPVAPVPGPSAAVAALSVSGLPTDRFLFVGFPPDRPQARRREFERLVSVEATLLFYLSPHRLEKSLQDLLEVFGDRDSFLVREMTKVHETAYWGSLSEIIEEVSREESRGEYTLVIQGHSGSPSAQVGIDLPSYVTGLVKTRGVSRSEAIRQAARELRLPRKQVYEAVVLGRALHGRDPLRKEEGAE